MLNQYLDMLPEITKSKAAYQAQALSSYSVYLQFLLPKKTLSVKTPFDFAYSKRTVYCFLWPTLSSLYLAFFSLL